MFDALRRCPGNEDAAWLLKVLPNGILEKELDAEKLLKEKPRPCSLFVAYCCVWDVSLLNLSAEMGFGPAFAIAPIDLAQAKQNSFLFSITAKKSFDILAATFFFDYYGP